MTHNRKFSFSLLTLGFLISCTWAAAEIPEEVLEAAKNATVVVRVERGYGGGFFIAPDMIVTNIHVVAGDRDVSVFGKDGKGKVVYNIEKVIGSDPAHDLVILQVSGKQKATPLSLSNCQIGDPIFVVGHPKGERYKISDGIVHVNNDTNIRLDAKIYPGNSGGPVLNLKGEVVGIAVGKDGANVTLFNAIPSDILDALLKKSKSEQGQSWDEWRQRDSIRAYFYFKLGMKYYNLGMEYKDSSKYDKAIENYTEAVKLYRDFTDAYKYRGIARHRLGNSNRKNGNVKKARSLYEEAIEDLNKSPDGAYAYYLLAKVKSDLGNLEANSKDGKREKALKHYQDAVSDYSTAIDIDKQNRNYPVLLEKAYLHRMIVYFHLGDLKSNQGNTTKAQSLYSEGLDDFAKAVKLDPDGASDFKLDPQGTAYGYYIQGGLELIRGQSKASQGDVEKAQKHYQSAFQSYGKAEKLNPDDADVYYDKAIKILNPDNADTYQIRGVFKSLLGQSKAKQGEVQEARQHYQEAIEDYQEAVKRYKNATKQNSEYIVFAYRNLGSTKHFLGKSFESESGLENIEYAHNLYEEAIVDYTKAVKLNPNDGTAYSNRGVAKADIEDYDGAIADLSKAVELKPDSATAYYERGRVYQKTGQQKKAEVDFKKAKELNPNIGK